MSTAIILAGGMSSRMGVNKAELMIRGKTLLDIQIAKVRKAGLKKILVSVILFPGKICTVFTISIRIKVR